ncbi:Cell division protein FtsI [Peptidoglycan synthetase] [Chitinispirillum alkaliphilum]|nr:Cell division protein FtsI [Peptidoglycan synthetase] [Chitinispirillum alkaliphilum]
MNQFKVRLIFVCVLFTLLGLVMVSRLFAIQILEGERYAMRSRAQAQQRRELIARRGAIKDRNGRVLAASTQDRLSVNMNVLGAESDELTTVSRIYPNGDVAGPLLGYIGRDGYGLAGVEFSFDYYLRGENGWTIIHRDGHNHSYRKIGLPEKEPVDGSDVYLTIDLEIQKTVQSVLSQTVSELNAKGGMAIVIDPRSGKILAMVNEPSFNPNLPSRYPLSSRKNRCLGVIYEPGSTFKVVTAAAALQEGLITAQDTIDGNQGVYRIHNEVIRDIVPRGKITFAEAMSYSSNVCFAKTANMLGNERFFRYAKNFGMGVRTGVDLPGEEEGILHPVRSWSGRTRATMAIGYEVSATLLQMMMPFASVANGGILVTPMIYERVVAHDGSEVKTARYKPVRRVVSEEVSRELRDMLRKAVVEGTGRNADVPGISVAGKTGTSRKSGIGGYAENLYWSSFIGFAPADDPVLLCGIVIDEPGGGEMGGAAAAPAFRKIMTQIISNPRLDYARKILRHPVISEDEKNQPFRVGEYVGASIESVKADLDKTEVSVLVIGTGDYVRYQSPAAGSLIERDGEVILFVNRVAEEEPSEKLVPNLVGRDMRDAFNVLNLKGINSVVVGGGRVKRQVPAPGAFFGENQACTLFCAFER